jgi:hypothetical protein
MRRSPRAAAANAVIPFAEREREDPLAHGDGRQDAIDEVRGGVRHAASSAAWADASALATEGDEEVAAAVVAVASQEAMGEDAARKVAAERLLDVVRKTARVILPGMIEEGLEVVANEGVENGLRRVARDVVGGRLAVAPPDGVHRCCRGAAREHGAGRLAIAVPRAGRTSSWTWPATWVAAATFRHGAASSAFPAISGNGDQARG